MERKIISIDALKKVLSPKEMKNVLGGSGGGDCLVQCGDNGQVYPITCWDILDCESQCYAKCGDCGWSTNCY